MEPLNIMYIMFTLVGVIFLVLSMLGGDVEAELDLDVGDPDFDISDAESDSGSTSLFSIRTLATFLLAFGVAGIVCMYNDKGIAAQLIWGFISGAGVAFLYFLVMRFMYSMQGSSMISANNLIGKDAVVTIPTTETGIGQVRVMTNSGNYEYTCREKEGKKLKQNETVKVLSSTAGTLTVEKQ
jgi:membrane protein implicated in regulation of membrane protease activity